MLIRMVLTLATVAGAVLAQGSELDDGRDLFLYFCAECHGKDVASVGPLAEILAIEPPNLTNLAKRYAGTFPTDVVAMQVDGRIPVEAHSFMPVFDPSLDSDQMVALKLPSGQPLMVSEQLANLILYLQSVQTVTENAE
ncbi:c-type cytochrome [Roseovarius aestuarii]|uniref:Cytochrome c domain-containing protein n=1 Tax=Roseovarius aestuarii TaxID=475083 RepID=A0A1X7BWJ2_9RHOB|nr:c-type cytochrome [Roseovarius aestuarii]SMC13993.1 hypothetical protein ROA7745_03855 [Roseovarius aestuarii]